MLIDLCKVQFEIYHGEGTVEYSSNNIILLGFKCLKIILRALNNFIS
jgi:hypothetical protein